MLHYRVPVYTDSQRRALSSFSSLNLDSLLSAVLLDYFMAFFLAICLFQNGFISVTIFSSCSFLFPY